MAVLRKAPTHHAANSGLTLCRDGLLALPDPTVFKVVGAPHDTTDLRAVDVAAGACRVFPSLIRCRREALKSGSAAGRLEIGLVIDEQGAVTSARRSGGTIAVGPLSRCVEQALAEAKFVPAAKGEIRYDVEIADPKGTVALIENGTDIAGRLTPGEVKSEVRANFPRFRACYEAVLKNDPDAVGEARIRFTIDPSGNVTDAFVGAAAFHDPAVEGCMLSVVRSLHFPPPEKGRVLVTYPIFFTSDK